MLRLLNSFITAEQNVSAEEDYVIKLKSTEQVSGRWVETVSTAAVPEVSWSTDHWQGID